MEQLKLDNQLCFSLYATSRMITRIYQPLLEKLDLTYPQFLVMLVLWEHREATVGQICKKLLLNTNTTTPIIQKLIDKGFLVKNRSLKDERIVLISLTNKGEELKTEAAHVPECVVSTSGLQREEIDQMKSLMDQFLLNMTTTSQLENQK